MEAALLLAWYPWLCVSSLLWPPPARAFRWPGMSGAATHAISIAPAGFNMAYTAGAAYEVRRRCDGGVVHVGMSTGSVVACCLCVGISAERLVQVLTTFASAYSSRERLELVGRLGRLLERELPHDAHLRCKGRLAIGVTRVRPRAYARLALLVALALALLPPSRQRRRRRLGWVLLAVAHWASASAAAEVVTSFPTRASLIEALLASCSIPLVQDHTRLRRDAAGYLVDGSFAHSLLRVQGLPTTTIDWRTTRGDVHPDAPLAPRVVTAPSPEEVERLFARGVADAARAAR